jgi:hypothetical protein
MRLTEARRRGRDRDHPLLVTRWRETADRHLTPLQRSLLITWISFGVTFGTVRVITHGIRGGWLPWGNISAGGEHLHAVRGDERTVGHPGVAAAYGCGTALICDEFALLLDLQDVYWAKQGRISVDVSLGVLSTLGAYLTAKPFWHEIGRVTRHHIVAAATRHGATA